MGDKKKVIVIGLDGLEPKIAEPMFNNGDLPNLAKLRSQGGYTRVRTTYPAQTPVAWSTFTTGTNPGGHGIFDFVGRDARTYFPLLALNRYEQKNALLPPQAVNRRRGTPVWQFLSQAGLPSTIIRCPCNFPPDNVRGKILAGVGVPDLRGGLGTSTFYSSDASVKPEESENVVHVLAQPSGRIETHVVGPRNPKTRADLHFGITLQVEAAARKIVVHSEGQPRTLEVHEGRWSDWLRVKFKTGPLMSVRGMVRFYLVRLAPIFELYASPINFDPNSPLFPISSPHEYAQEMASKLGTFYTTGMVEDHGGIINGRFGEAAYLAQCQEVLRERERMMLYELERFREGLFFCLFDTPDRLQHIFWRFREPEHPANRGGLAPDMSHVIEDHYRDCDRVVGQALQYADERTLFVVLSDHGMNSFQRGVNLNTWLHDNGLLALRDGIQPGPEAGDFFHHVDWAHTQAYVVGLGGIYLNLKGREAQGIVGGDDAEHIKSGIVKSLTGIRDAERGRLAVDSVFTREQIYSGPFASESPDVLVNFAEGYRASWGTPLGGVPAGLFEDNVKKWGGDHAINPSRAPGVLLMNQKFRAANAGLVDLAPTILSVFAVPKGPAMEGRSLLDVDGYDAPPSAEEQQSSVTQLATEDVSDGLSEEDEETIRERLRGLGYIE